MIDNVYYLAGGCGCGVRDHARSTPGPNERCSRGHLATRATRVAKMKMGIHGPLKWIIWYAWWHGENIICLIWFTNCYTFLVYFSGGRDIVCLVNRYRLTYPIGAERRATQCKPQPKTLWV